MNKRKHNGITLLPPNAFMRKVFKFGTRRDIEKREQLTRKILKFNEHGIPREVNNPSWKEAVRSYYANHSTTESGAGRYGLTLESFIAFAS